MGFWEFYDKVRPPQQTVSDDAHSRLARRDAVQRDQIKRVELDDVTGEQLLWFDVSVSVVGEWLPMDWPGTDQDDVRDTVLEWIAADDWITVDYRKNGADAKLTFRSSWVAGFTVGKGRRRQ